MQTFLFNVPGVFFLAYDYRVADPFSLRLKEKQLTLFTGTFRSLRGFYVEMVVKLVFNFFMFNFIFQVFGMPEVIIPVVFSCEVSVSTNSVAVFFVRVSNFQVCY